MANRDAKLIERTLKDFSLGAMSGGGGLAPVDKLPEKGNVGTLYKLPNGEIWSWYHEERQEEVEVPPTLEVGKTYELKEEMTFRNYKLGYANLVGKFMGEVERQDINFQFDSETLFTTNGDLNTFVFKFFTEVQENPNPPQHAIIGFVNPSSEDGGFIVFNVDTSEPHPDDEIITIDSRDVTLPVLITINQEFADWFEEHNAILQDIAFLFKGEVKPITTVNEGYTKVNGAIVLDIDNIQDNTIYNDTYYNASLIINNVKRGVPVALKNGDSFNTLSSAILQEGSSSISFSNGTNIILTPENVFNPATITGAELKEQMRLIKEEWGLDFRGDNLMSYIHDSGQVSEEEAQKLMAPGTIISLFDGLITLDYILSTGEEDDHIDYELYLNSPTEPWGELFGYFDGEPCLGNVHRIWSSSVVGSDWSNIENSKEYSTDIIIKFADNTTKAIKTTKDYISTIFSQNIPA